MKPPSPTASISGNTTTQKTLSFPPPELDPTRKTYHRGTSPLRSLSWPPLASWRSSRGPSGHRQAHPRPRERRKQAVSDKEHGEEREDAPVARGMGVVAERAHRGGEPDDGRHPLV